MGGVVYGSVRVVPPASGVAPSSLNTSHGVPRPDLLGVALATAETAGAGLDPLGGRECQAFDDAEGAGP